MSAGMPVCVDDVTAGLVEVAWATERLLNAVDSLDERSVRAASLLPGWSRAHVLTHLARHADALGRVVVAARYGERIDPYPGGVGSRAAEIVAGSGRSAALLKADLRGAAGRLSDAWRQVDLWTPPLAVGVVARWVEVEVHHVDLTIGYYPADWPAEFTATALGAVLGGLPGRVRTNGGDRAGWLLYCPDTGAAWHVDRSAERAVVRPAVGEPDVTYVVEGDSRSMLAWLLGRPMGEPLRVTRGGRAAALSLPAQFPFP